MTGDFSHLNKREQLKAENDFIKMKLMLEKGAQFETISEEELSPDIENEFLNYIMEFEKQAANTVSIKIFDKIGRPTHFKPVVEIPDQEIERAWENISDYLYQYGISLDVCSPNITKRELYRFTIEELFEYEIDDMNIPGMMQGFIYDEFYPDPVYENTQIAVEDCIKKIVCKEPFEWIHHFRKENIRLNDQLLPKEEDFKYRINRFKAAFEEIELDFIKDINCVPGEKYCNIKGAYAAIATLLGEKVLLNGNWIVEFEKDEELGYWYIINVQIEGIGF